MQDSPHPRQGQEGRHLRFLPSCAPARRQRRFPRFASAPLPMNNIIKIDKYP